MDDDNGNAFLRFYMDTPMKQIELLYLQFRQASDELVAEIIAYRINSLKEKSKIALSRLADITKILKDQTPDLIEQI